MARARIARPLVPDVPRVGPDNVAAVTLPLRRLAELGHSRVAFLSAPRRLMADPDRLTAFRRVARRLGLRPLVVYTAAHPGGGASGDQPSAGRAHRRRPR